MTLSADGMRQGDVANGTAIDPKYRALARARQEAATRKRTMQASLSAHCLRLLHLKLLHCKLS